MLSNVKLMLGKCWGVGFWRVLVLIQVKVQMRFSRVLVLIQAVTKMQP